MIATLSMDVTSTLAGFGWMGVGFVMAGLVTVVTEAFRAQRARRTGDPARITISDRGLARAA